MLFMCNDCILKDWYSLRLAVFSIFEFVYACQWIYVFLVDKIVGSCMSSRAGESDVKACIAVLHFFIASSAKFDVEESTLARELQQLGLPKGLLSVLLFRHVLIIMTSGRDLVILLRCVSLDCLG